MRVAVWRYSAVTVLRLRPVARATSEMLSLSRPIKDERWQRIMATVGSRGDAQDSKLLVIKVTAHDARGLRAEG